MQAFEALEEINPEVAKEAVLRETEQDDDTYNCMGLVARVFGWEATLTEVYSDEIQEMLTANTTQVDRDDLQYGDIVVYRADDGEIEHIGININTRKEYILMKPGSFSLTIDEFVGVEYDYGEPNEFYRVN